MNISTACDGLTVCICSMFCCERFRARYWTWLGIIFLCRFTSSFYLFILVRTRGIWPKIQIDSRKYLCGGFMFSGRRCALWWEASADPSEPCGAALPSVWHPEVSKWPRHEWGARAPLWDGPETGWPCSGSVWRKPGEKKRQTGRF